MRKLALASALALVAMTHAWSFDTGQYQDVPPKIREWFRTLRSPMGLPCCDIADGHRTTWRATTDGSYEVPIEGQWHQIPPETILRNAKNPTGEAIVWYYRQQGEYIIRCFVPGEGV